MAYYPHDEAVAIHIYPLMIINDSRNYGAYEENKSSEITLYISMYPASLSESLLQAVLIYDLVKS